MSACVAPSKFDDLLKAAAAQVQLAASVLPLLAAAAVGAKFQDREPISIFESVGLENAAPPLDTELGDRMHHIEISLATDRRHCALVGKDVHRASIAANLAFKEAELMLANEMMRTVPISSRMRPGTLAFFFTVGFRAAHLPKYKRSMRGKSAGNSADAATMLSTTSASNH